MATVSKWFYIVMAGVTLWGGLMAAWYEPGWLHKLGIAIAAFLMSGLIFRIALAIEKRWSKRSPE